MRTALALALGVVLPAPVVCGQGLAKQVIAVTGQNAGGGWTLSGHTLWNVASAQPNRVVFAANVTSASLSRAAVLEWNQGQLTPWYLPGMSVDGLEPGVDVLSYFYHFDYGPTERAGHLYARCSLIGPGVTSSNDGVFLGCSASSIRVLAREGQPLPGLPNSTWMPWAEDWKAQVDGGCLLRAGNFSNAIVQFNADGADTAVAVPGDPAPGLPGQHLEYIGFGVHSLSDASRVFYSRTNGGTHAVFADAPDGSRSLLFPGPAVPNMSWPNIELGIVDAIAGPAVLLESTPSSPPNVTGRIYLLVSSGQASVAAQSGGPAAGLPGMVTGGLEARLSRDGDVITFGSYRPAFTATPVGEGVWRRHAGNTELVLASGAQVPDAAPGYVTTGMSTLTDPIAQSDGRVVMLWGVTPPGSNTPQSWLLARLRDGSIITVARVGEQVTIAPGDVRTITGFSAYIRHNSDNGAPGQFADDGGLAFVVSLSGVGSQGALLYARLPDTRLCDSADFNRDGITPDVQDIHDFLTVFAGAPCPSAACGDADFNNDAIFPDIDDIAALIRVFGGGPCVE